MKTIVSVTPVRVEADSRTFKQAASITAFGYTSVVVEGERSALDSEDLPFQLHSLGNGSLIQDRADMPVNAPAASTSDEQASKPSLRGLGSRLGVLNLIELRHY